MAKGLMIDPGASRLAVAGRRPVFETFSFSGTRAAGRRFVGVSARKPGAPGETGLGLRN